MKNRLLSVKYTAIALIILLIIAPFFLPIKKIVLRELYNHLEIVDTLNNTFYGNLLFSNMIKIFGGFEEKDIYNLISISTASQAIEKREQLLNTLFGSQETPKTLPRVSENHEDIRYEDITTLAKINKLDVEMDFDIHSYAYHFIPKNPNSKVILFHQGHDGDFYQSKNLIKLFLDKGFAVVGFSMPLLGLNNQPVVDLPELEEFQLINHDQMRYLKPELGHPMKYFIQPVTIVINYLDSEYNYVSLSMTGISGGGWTTTLAAAVDNRIDFSFPVAGSYPIFLRFNNPGEWGDYEQTAPEFYSRFNYLELYFLGSYGKKRKQIQILNKYDPCCFSGDYSNTYKNVIAKRLSKLNNGEYDIFVDDSHSKHQISPVAIKLILNTIESGQTSI